MPGCSTDGDCLCGQWCVNDPNDIPLSRICETPCTSNSECSNAASHCTNEAVPVNPAHAGNTCTVNNCHGLHPGGACDVTAAGAMDGTCVPFDGWTVMGFAVCILNGTATTCTEGTTNDDPLLAQPNGSSNGEIIISPQSKADGDVLCGAGQGCYVANAPALGTDDSVGSCTTLCPAPGDGGARSSCTTGVCVTQDYYDQSWGYCVACLPSASDGGPASECVVNTDCCESNCSVQPGNHYGSCQPEGR